MKTTSVAVKGTSKWLDKEGDGRCLVVKTLVSFKNNGLLCRNCTHHLHRPPGIKSTTDLTIGKCGRCKNNFNLIGLECGDVVAGNIECLQGGLIILEKVMNHLVL